MRIGWIGFHLEGLPALQGVLESGLRLEAVITLRRDLAAKRSGSVDYSPVCRKFKVPLYEVANINDPESLKLLEKLSLDVAFVIGWTQLVKRQVLDSVRIGMIGAHASLLPKDRGRAPINWALIKSQKEGGNTLIWLSDDVDKGDIIGQVAFPIGQYDTCSTLYDKVADSNRKMILEAISLLQQGTRPGRSQLETDAPVLPGRRPEDGLINWSVGADQVYDLVRAITRPYPGAYSYLEGRRWTIWHCALLPQWCGFNALPGEIIGSVFSPVEDACGQVVACGTGAVVLLEIENAHGELWRGRRLSDEHWESKTWRNE